MIEIRLDEILGSDDVEPMSEGWEPDEVYRARLMGSYTADPPLQQKLKAATGAELDAIGRELGLRRKGVSSF